MILVLIAILFTFRQPVLATVGRLLGYGYFPQVGFIQLDGPRVLRNPVKQEHAGQSLTVMNGVATSNETILWLEFSADPLPPDGAWLETTSGERLALGNWNWDPDQAGSRGIRLVFPPLPTGMDKMTLALPEGWRLPLEWIPAAQAGIPSTEIGVPYPTTQPIAQNSTPVNMTTPCVVNSGMQVCLQAAQTDAEGTRVLLKATSQDGQLTLGGGFHQLIAPNPLTKDIQITITDDLGNVIAFPEKPLDPSQTDGGAFLQPLTFPSISTQAKQITLRVPAFQASTTFREPLQLQVDLGTNPQPGQNLLVDQELKILSQTVRFRQATLEGDGVTSLRLTLISDPIVSNNGVLVNGLDLGRPEEIDDRYGSGFGGQSQVIKVFAELIGPVSGKKTGTLIFPIIGAQVLLLGPFEFTFAAPLPILTQPTEMPQVVGGESFTPQPSPTSLSLETYHYNGKAIQSDDLVFTVVGEATTDLFTFNPQSSTAPERIVTLPGQVYQVFVHPDRQGIDYLVGTRVTEDSFTFYRSIQIYSLRFQDLRPHLLASFPRGPENVKGSEMTANWSYDGRFVIFQFYNFYPKKGEATSRLGWIDLKCRETGNCQVQLLKFPDGIDAGQPQFSASDYRVLMTGGYYDERSIYGNELFVLEFYGEGRTGEITNLSNTQQIFELAPHWDPKTGRIVALCPMDPSEVHRQFCFYDSTTGRWTEGAEIDQHLIDYQIEPYGERILGIDINHQAADNNRLLEFRLFDWNGKSGPVLASVPAVNRFAESPDSRYFAYIVDQTEMMHLVDIPNGKEFSVPGFDESSIVSWLGWAP